MIQNFDLDSGLSVYILDFSVKKIISFKVYNVTRKFDEYSDYTPSLNPNISIQKIWRMKHFNRKASNFEKGNKCGNFLKL